MSLFKMWEETKMNKKLPQEWDNWCDFRTWAIANRYKAEYGYKGEFNPEGCLKAMPNYKEPEEELKKEITETKQNKTKTSKVKGGK